MFKIDTIFRFFISTIKKYYIKKYFNKNYKHLNKGWNYYDSVSFDLELYESEISHLFNTVTQFNSFIEIGAAQGYYAEKVLKLNSKLNLFLFEKDHRAYNKLKFNYRGNSNIHIFKEFTENFNIGILPSKSLLLCDVEGAESNIITQSFLDYFKHSLLIIEVHDLSLDEFLLNKIFDFVDVSRIEKIFFNGRFNYDLFNLYGQDIMSLLLSEGRHSSKGFVVIKPV